MNRDQRQSSGPPGAESPFAAAANAVPLGTIAEQFDAAVAHHQRGALAEAERRYLYILAQVPAHADSLHNLGLVALTNGNAAAAVDLIEKAIAADNRKAEYHYNIALAWRSLGRPDQVTAHLERAIALRGDHVLAHLNLGNVRREQGRLAEAVACYERALALAPNSAAVRLNLANMLSEQRRFDAAAAIYRQVLALEPNHAEAHCRLGAALSAQGHPRDAVPYIERAISLKPDLAGAHEELATAYLSAGNVRSALLAAARALELNETPEGQALFAQCMILANFTNDADGRFRKLVRRALVEAWAVPRELSGVCISLIKLDTRVTEMIARANAAWPGRLPAQELPDSPAMAALADDALLHDLLQCDPVTDIGLERLITNIRYALLRAFAAKDSEVAETDERLLDFCCAIARQCFVNQYVFAMTGEEHAQAKHLGDVIDQALAGGAPISAFHLAILGAYFPLYSLANAERLLEKSWPRAVKDLIVQQVEEPAEERRIRATLTALTSIEGEVSRAVREQYEENPYPRWIKGGPPVQPAILNRRSQPLRDVLIAGCGTGIFTTEFARKALGARFLAIDLSLASLSYAKRMAQGFGLTNVEFAQADITKLTTLGRTFDFIEFIRRAASHRRSVGGLADSRLAVAPGRHHADRALQRTGTAQCGRGPRADRRARLSAGAGRYPAHSRSRRWRARRLAAEIDQPVERFLHYQRVPGSLIPSAGTSDLVARDQIVPCGERPAIRGLHPRCLDVRCLRQAFSGDRTSHAQSAFRRFRRSRPLAPVRIRTAADFRRHVPVLGAQTRRAFLGHDPEDHAADAPGSMRAAQAQRYAASAGAAAAAAAIAGTAGTSLLRSQSRAAR